MFVRHWIGADEESTFVFTKETWWIGERNTKIAKEMRIGERNTKIAKEMLYPNDLCGSGCKGAILRFAAGPRDYRLLLRTLGNKIGTKID